jgi:hypothetical protein
MKARDGSGVLEIFSRHTVDEIDSGEESLIPEPNRERGVGKKGNARLDDVPMLALSNAVLLRGVRACHAVFNASAIKEARETTILASSVHLNCTNFGLEQKLNMGLKVVKRFLNI